MNSKKIVRNCAWLATISMLWTGALSADALSGGDYTVDPLDVNGGGTRSASANYALTASTAQHGGVGAISGGVYELGNGFWHGASAPSFGSVQVTLEPPEAVAAGARWRLVGTGRPWRPSEYVESGLVPGPYWVRFKEVLTPAPGWCTPANRQVTVIAGQTTQITQTYSGRIRAMIGPPSAVSDGAKWRVVGKTGWLDSGDVAGGGVGSLPLDTYTIRFKDLATPAPGWTTPARRIVTNDQPRTLSATYQGTIRMTLLPAGAVLAGAQWRVMGTGPWHNSGERQGGLTVGGTYTVRFKDVAGWTRPPRQDILVNGPTTGTATYTAQGALPSDGGAVKEEDVPTGVGAAAWMLY